MTEPHMVKCLDCREEFDISGGYILMHVCPDCLKKPKPPEAYIMRCGILIPNSEAQKQ